MIIFMSRWRKLTKLHSLVISPPLRYYSDQPTALSPDPPKNFLINNFKINQLAEQSPHTYKKNSSALLAVSHDANIIITM